VGQREKGLALLSAASQQEPGNAQYRLDYLQQQALALRDALVHGDDGRRTQQFDVARQWYESALRIDPASDRALRGLTNVDMDVRHVVMLAESDKAIEAGRLEEARDRLHKVLLEEAGNVAAQRLMGRLNEKREAAETARAAQVSANSLMKKPVSLQFREANLRIVFEALSRTTGLNVIFDRDVRPELKTTIFVHDASVEDTVDLILLQSQLEKKVLNANTLFIYPATAAKQKEYQDLKIRVFQLSNADGKYVQTVLKSVLKAADLTLDEHSNTIVVRGTPDMIAVAEKVIAAQDQPDPEVMLELEILEVQKNRHTNLGIQWPSAFGVATPSASSLSALNATRLANLVPNPASLTATLNLLLTDGDTNVLASPRIRVRDREKAKILIGNRIPMFTQQLQPFAAAGGAGGSGGYSTATFTSQVQYLDIGIKLEVEPHVYLEGDVGIKMSLEVSSKGNPVVDPVTKNTAYEISTRNAMTSLRLRDGETQILGGLINEQRDEASNGIPGLGQIPILNHLFGSNDITRNKDELVISITPHVLRAPALGDRRLREVFSGTEASVRENPLRLDPIGAVSNTSEAVTPGFVGGGGGTTPGSATSPGTPVDPRVPAQRHARPPAGTPWPPGAAPASGQGDPATPAATERTPAPEAPAPAPAASPATGN
jgi:general secretion pathway protein D